MDITDVQNDEMERKSLAWDIVYPAIIFMIEVGTLPPNGISDLKRAVKIINESGDPN